MKIIDTSVLVAYFNQEDSQNSIAFNILKDLSTGKISVYDYIFTETLTVLRNKTTVFHCEAFIKFLEFYKIEINLINKEIINLATDLFFKFKDLSFTDSLLLATAKINSSDLLTFDKSLQKAWEELNLA